MQVDGHDGGAFIPGHAGREVMCDGRSVGLPFPSLPGGPRSNFSPAGLLGLPHPTTLHRHRSFCLKAALVLRDPLRSGG